MTTKNKEHVVDLQHIEFDKDGIVRLALHRKETQRAMWKSMQQFKDIKPTVPKTKNSFVSKTYFLRFYYGLSYSNS